MSYRTRADRDLQLGKPSVKGNTLTGIRTPDSFEIAEEREKAEDVLLGKRAFTREEMQRILARLVSDG
jgi:hypothetical protein